MKKKRKTFIFKKKKKKKTPMGAWDMLFDSLGSRYEDILQILWKGGEMAPKEQFLLFFTIFFYLF